MKPLDKVELKKGDFVFTIEDGATSRIRGKILAIHLHESKKTSYVEIMLDSGDRIRKVLSIDLPTERNAK